MTLQVYMYLVWHTYIKLWGTPRNTRLETPPRPKLWLWTRFHCRWIWHIQSHSLTPSLPDSSPFLHFKGLHEIPKPFVCKQLEVISFLPIYFIQEVPCGLGKGFSPQAARFRRISGRFPGKIDALLSETLPTDQLRNFYGKLACREYPESIWDPFYWYHIKLWGTPHIKRGTWNPLLYQNPLVMTRFHCRWIWHIQSHSLTYTYIGCIYNVLFRTLDLNWCYMTFMCLVCCHTFGTLLILKAAALSSKILQ
jgi:hypothetical protein